MIEDEFSLFLVLMLVAATVLICLGVGFKDYRFTLSGIFCNVTVIIVGLVSLLVEGRF